MRGSGAGRWAAGAAVAVLLAGCGSGDGPVARLGTPVAAPAPTSTEVVATTVEPSTSTSRPTVTTVPPPPLPGLGPGARGPEVLALEQRLDALHYDVGSVDGVYDRVTAYAVMAFQKVHGFGRTGRATDDIVASVRSADGNPAPLVPGGPSDRVEVDIPRQVLFLYRGGSLAKILPVSTGSNRRFCDDGWCRTAVTPGGSFVIYRQAHGWEHGPLGDLYNPLYFNGGIAIHGAASVPGGPASHGCVRIPMNAAEWLPSQVGLGTAVYVIGGPEDVPPPAPAPPAAGDQPATTVTTSPPGLLDGLLKHTTTTSPDGKDKDRKNRD